MESFEQQEVCAGLRAAAGWHHFALRLLILPADGRVVFSTFYPAVALVAITAGIGWGIFATALSTLLVYAFLMPPLLAWKPLGYVDLLSIGTFLAVAAIILLQAPGSGFLMNPVELSDWIQAHLKLPAARRACARTPSPSARPLPACATNSRP